MAMIDEEKVTINLKAIGPSRPGTLLINSRIKVHHLRELVATELSLPKERSKLILHGKVLTENGDDTFVNLSDGDSLVVAVAPTLAKHIRDAYDDCDDNDELKFQVPDSSSWIKRRLFSFLKDQMKVPDILLMAIFSTSLKTWVLIFLWFVLAPLAHKWDIGPLYILGTGFCIILFNLGKRQHGDLSAYSIFNEDFRELPGTLNADHIDRDIRAGRF